MRVVEQEATPGSRSGSRRGWRSENPLCGGRRPGTIGARGASAKIVDHEETSRFVRTSRALTRAVAHFGSVRNVPSTRQTPHVAKASSGSNEFAGKCGAFVEQLSLLQAVVQLAEHPVEQVPPRGGTPLIEHSTAIP
ncbi:hypothetical protein ACIOKD_25280 [Streptomyces sp. NPDC087844]|uniref:hypothetical protein n=1 Tax=Streptomyces sp. NPDC087844 TaxID=3365805 RepID=UPI0037F9B8F6